MEVNYFGLETGVGWGRIRDGCGHKRVTGEILVMLERVDILIVVVDTQTYPGDKCIKLHTHTHTHTEEKNLTRLVDYNDVSILVVILHYSFTKCLIFISTAHECAITLIKISIKII